MRKISLSTSTHTKEYGVEVGSFIYSLYCWAEILDNLLLGLVKLNFKLNLQQVIAMIDPDF